MTQVNGHRLQQLLIFNRSNRWRANLPSILTEEVVKLASKMNEHAVSVKVQWEYQPPCLMCLTEMLLQGKKMSSKQVSDWCRRKTCFSLHLKHVLLSDCKMLEKQHTPQSIKFLPGCHCCTLMIIPGHFMHLLLQFSPS